MRVPLDKVREKPLDLDKLTDIWEFYSWVQDGEVPCPDTRRFLMLLLSPRTHLLERWQEQEANNLEVCLCISGPVTDDEGCLFATRTIKRSEVWDLTTQERKAFRDALLRIRVCERDKKNILLKDPVGTRTSAVLRRLGFK